MAKAHTTQRTNIKIIKENSHQLQRETCGSSKKELKQNHILGPRKMYENHKHWRRYTVLDHIFPMSTALYPCSAQK